MQNSFHPTQRSGEDLPGAAPESPPLTLKERERWMALQQLKIIDEGYEYIEGQANAAWPCAAAIRSRS